MAARAFDRKSALAFIVAFGVVSLFADMAYEGMRSSTGPFLALLGASAAAVGVIAGAGELFGYVLRLASGSVAARSRAYWVIAIAGYVIQMAAVPLMAFAGNWQVAAFLIILERTGKAVRNPAASTMMSRAGAHIGQGWAFGLHEALDQTGALAGPLIAAFVLARHGDYRAAFLWLGIPALLTVTSVLLLRLGFPYAGQIAKASATARGARDLSPAFWLYAAAAALVGFGFADYPLMAFHYARAGIVSAAWIPIFYALAMGASGAASLGFGRWFDRRGLVVVIPGIVIGALAAPLVFLGRFDTALAGTLLWGTALGIHEAIMSAAVARLVPEHARARAYGYFTAIFGVAWFLGSSAMGMLYEVSIPTLVAVAAAAELSALVPLFFALRAGAGRA